MCCVPVQGNKEHLGDLTKTFPLWIAMTIGEEYSYSKMTVVNTTHLLWEQISAEVCVSFSGHVCVQFHCLPVWFRHVLVGMDFPS